METIKFDGVNVIDDERVRVINFLQKRGINPKQTVFGYGIEVSLEDLLTSLEIETREHLEKDSCEDTEQGEADNSKTLNNTDIKQAKEQVSDIEVFGNSDAWELICKTSSKKENWMKSTKAMQMPNGCLIQVTTQQGDNIAEALTYVPNVEIAYNENNFWGFVKI